MHNLLPFLRLYYRHWIGLVLGMLLALVTLSTSIGLLTLSGWFLSASALTGLTAAREAFNYTLPGVIIRVLTLVRTASRWGERVISHSVTFTVLSDLRISFFDQLSLLIPSRNFSLRNADILNRMVWDIDAMDHIYLRLVSPMLVGILGVAFLTVFLCYFDATIGITLGSFLFLSLVTWPFIFYRLGKDNGTDLTNQGALLRVAYMDWIQGFSELCVFGADKKYRRRFHDCESQFHQKQRFNANTASLSQALLIMFNGIVIVLILGVASDGVGSGDTGQEGALIPMVFFATIASSELLLPVAGAFQYLGHTLESAQRLNEIFQAKPEVVFSPDSHPISNYDIEFLDVHFHYQRETVPALSAINLTVKTGEKLAIIGPTGSGKSTLVQLLSRCWDPVRGEILIGQRPLTRWSETLLRQSVTTVSQRVDILNSTLRDNILVANAEASDSEIAHHLELVGLGRLLDKSGLNTWLGEGGRQLSGGEKRLISVARSLMHQGEIILLDEPTEGLDKLTEKSIMELLLGYFERKTILFVTHRLVNLDLMDYICLMENGRIAEFGSHQALMAQQGLYFQLAGSQELKEQAP